MKKIEVSTRATTETNPEQPPVEKQVSSWKVAKSHRRNKYECNNRTSIHRRAVAARASPSGTRAQAARQPGRGRADTRDCRGVGARGQGAVRGISTRRNHGSRF